MQRKIIVIKRKSVLVKRTQSIRIKEDTLCRGHILPVFMINDNEEITGVPGKYCGRRGGLHRAEFYCLSPHVLAVPSFTMRGIIIA